MTLRPFFVAMRARKPWVRLRLICDGWNVLFMGIYLITRGGIIKDGPPSVKSCPILLYKVVPEGAALGGGGMCDGT